MNLHIYRLIAGAPGRPVSGHDPVAGALPLLNVDVRGVARAQVLALKLPSFSKRFILFTSTFTWKEEI
ncbi:hypothetical protein BJY52DRAFT_1296728 [Lactarius psammicola]|nr:hypothetical protein BJY52DRAFT_1296728 [Lactarius psammicola]